MARLFKFIYKYRAFFTFLLFQLFCSWLIVKNNQYQSTRYFNSANQVTANIIRISQNIKEYFSLRQINNDLASANAALRKQIDERNQVIEEYGLAQIKNGVILNRYEYVSAKVVNNSTSQYKNFITINKGTDQGIAPGMAVISQQGIIGKVKSVSAHYAVLISLLNIDDHVSGKIKRTGHFGTVQWDGINSRIIDLRYIPRHVTPLVGDTIITSGYNAVFPEGIMIGIIKDVKLREESAFYQIKVELAQDFSKVAFVDVVKSQLHAEQDSLETTTKGIQK